MGELLLAGIEQQSITDGPGLRLTIFVQGCPHHCSGCHNPGTLPFEGGIRYTTGQVLDLLRKNPLLRGITFSGGEPICQSEALAQLAELVKQQGKDVVCYTGYMLEELLEMCEKQPEIGRLLTLVDILVDGPFIAAERDLTLAFCGSRNQRVLHLPQTLALGKPVLWNPISCAV